EEFSGDPAKWKKFLGHGFEYAGKAIACINMANSIYEFYKDPDFRHGVRSAGKIAEAAQALFKNIKSLAMGEKAVEADEALLEKELVEHMAQGDSMAKFAGLKM